MIGAWPVSWALGRTESAELMFGVRSAGSGRTQDSEGPVPHGNPREAIASGFGFAPEDPQGRRQFVAELSVREKTSSLPLQAQRGFGDGAGSDRVEQDRLAAPLHRAPSYHSHFEC